MGDEKAQMHHRPITSSNVVRLHDKPIPAERLLELIDSRLDRVAVKLTEILKDLDTNVGDIAQQIENIEHVLQQLSHLPHEGLVEERARLNEALSKSFQNLEGIWEMMQKRAESGKDCG